MHHGIADGLAALCSILLIGVVSLLSFFISIVASSRHSTHGIKGVLLFLLITILLMSLAVAIDNFLWDVLQSHIDFINIVISSAVSYLAPLPFLRRLYLIENRSQINKALIICMALLAALFSIWFIAETVI